MISGMLASAICEDAGILFQETCEKTLEEVMESKRFESLAAKVRAELPEITDADIMRHMIIVYSGVISSV